MSKVGVVLLAATDTPEGTGRMANALMTTREFLDGGDEVTLIFDGAGTAWILVLADPEQKYHRLLEAVRAAIGGACLYCSRAYGVKDAVEAAGVSFLSEYKDHPSLRDLVANGYR